MYLFLTSLLFSNIPAAHKLRFVAQSILIASLANSRHLDAKYELTCVT